MLYRTLVLGSALATTNALQIDSLPVRNDIVSRRPSLRAIAAFGLAVPAAFAKLRAGSLRQGAVSLKVQAHTH